MRHNSLHQLISTDLSTGQLIALLYLYAGEQDNAGV
jgi:hypothetical protein